MRDVIVIVVLVAWVVMHVAIIRSERWPRLIGRAYRWLLPPETILRFLDVTGLREPVERLLDLLVRLLAKFERR